MTTFNNHGTPSGFVSAAETADAALLHSNVPPFGGQRKIAVDASTAVATPKYSLVGANGQLFTYTTGPEVIGAAIGVTVTDLTAAAIEYADDEGEDLFVMVATSGNFLLEALNLPAAVAALSKSEQLRIVQAAMSAGGDNMVVSSNRFSAV